MQTNKKNGIDCLLNFKNEISTFSLEELKRVKRDLDKQMVKDFTTNVDLIKKLSIVNELIDSKIKQEKK